jgi:DNA-binding transcriptional MerR regulator
MNTGSELLVNLRSEAKLKLKDLLFHVNRLFPLLLIPQTPPRYGGLLTERTVRYYMKEGLIKKPSSYAGRFAEFSYRHILQTLVVKHLQLKGMSLREIRDITGSLEDRKLEDMLLETAVRVETALQVPYVDALPRQSMWRRYRINEKLEIHVDEGFDARVHGVDMEAAARMIMGILTGLGRTNERDEKNRDTRIRLPMDDGDLGYNVSAGPLSDLSGAVIALVTEGGLVPLGNPDRLESARSTKYLKYSLRGINDLESEVFESIDRGWDNTYVNADPDRLVPLDVMRELEGQGIFLRLHEYLYTTTGVAMPVDTAKKLGEKIARDLKNEGVSAVIFTST